MSENSTSRRRFLQSSGISLAGMGIASLFNGAPVEAATIHATRTDDTTLDGKAAWQKLQDGNLRFQRGYPIWPDQSTDRRTAIAKKQSPFAIVFSCVDSRVPPEIVFDQGLGDIFTIRTAAHVIDHAALGSIEYGVAELHIPLLVVLGHERCGAVSATIDVVDHHTTPPGSIKALTDYIRPAVLDARGTGATRLDNAVRINTQRTVQILRTSTILKDALNQKTLLVVGAHYDLDTGVVEVV